MALQRSSRVGTGRCDFTTRSARLITATSPEQLHGLLIPTLSNSAVSGAREDHFCDGSNLVGVENGSYDFVLSSHNLEHFANPVKALKEWQRVLRPGGSLILVLPHYAKTFDHRRKLTPVAHMIEDFERNTQEDDLSHLEEILSAPRSENGPQRRARSKISVDAPFATSRTAAFTITFLMNTTAVNC